MPNSVATPSPAIRLIGDSPVPIWGLSGAARLTRTLRSLDVADIGAWPAPVTGNAYVVLLHAGYLIEDGLLRVLLASPGNYLHDPNTGHVIAAHIPVAAATGMAEVITHRQSPAASGVEDDPGLRLLNPAQAEGYNEKLKKRVTAFVLPITDATKNQIEKRLFAAVYKGVTDIVTKHVWPWPAFHVTRACAAAGITPNMVTALSAVLTVAAFFLVANGQFGWGLAAAWGMTFLDTVDGKLARLTVKSSRFGDWFDHGLDLIHPPFWYWAWIEGIGASGGTIWQADYVMAIVLAGYVFQRLQEGGFELFFGITMHVWRPFDSRFRLINARRNPNLILLMAGAMLGSPQAGIVVVAVWMLICIGIHFVQIAQAAALRRQGPLRSWLAA